MKAMVLAAFTALALTAGIDRAHAEVYRAPAHNYYQNNWMHG